MNAVLKEVKQKKENPLFTYGQADTGEANNDFSMLPEGLQNAIDKINNIDLDRLNHAIDKIDSIDVNQLNNVINKVNQLVPNGDKQPESGGGILGFLGGINMQTWVILLVAGIVIWWFFFKDK